MKLVRRFISKWLNQIVAHQMIQMNELNNEIIDELRKIVEAGNIEIASLKLKVEELLVREKTSRTS